MNSTEALTKVEKLLELAKFLKDSRKAEIPPAKYEEFVLMYGEASDVIDRFVPKERIEVRGFLDEKNIYNNYIEAGFLSGSGTFELQAVMQLTQLVGRLRQLVAHPIPLRPEASITAVVESLRRFRECCQFLSNPPTSEKEVQEIMWIMLRSQFDRVDREETLPRFGLRSYRPDFGIPDLRLLIEAKFIGEKTGVGEIQQSILADVPAYLSGTAYETVLVFVYDHAQKLRDSRKFIEDVRSVEGIVDILVIPGVAPAA